MRYLAMIFCAALLIAIGSGAAIAPDSASIDCGWSLTETDADAKFAKELGHGDFVLSTERHSRSVLIGGAIQVPGEQPGSREFTIPKGPHFQVSLKRANEKSVIVDITVSETTVIDANNDGYNVATCQSKGRYSVNYSEPLAVKLESPKQNRNYEFRIVFNPTDAR